MAYKHTALETPSDVLTAELNSLADGAISSLSAEIANATAGNRWPAAMSFLSLAAQGTNRSVGSAVDIYVVPKKPGGSYPNVDGACMDNYRVKTVSLDDGSLAARDVHPRIPLPPTDCKIAIGNRTGQAFAATGNTFGVSEFSAEDV